MNDIDKTDPVEANEVAINTPNRAITPMDMLAIAVQQNAPIEQMERLWTLNEKVEAAMAKKAYVAAMAKFKLDPIVIIKDQVVKYENKDGSFTEYTHASLGNVAAKIAEKLAEYGFSHRWNTEQLEGGQIRVTCVVTHELGHSESVSMSNSRDDSGGKNNVQQLASTVTYLQRYTLLAVTGVATSEGDDDGRSSGEPAQASENFSLPDYTDEDFEENKPKWKALILSGKSSTKHTINMLESRFTLTKKQKAEIEGLTNANS